MTSPACPASSLPAYQDGLTQHISFLCSEKQASDFKFEEWPRNIPNICVFLIKLFSLLLNFCLRFTIAHFPNTQSLDPCFWLFPLITKLPLNWLTGSLAQFAFLISPPHVLWDEDSILQLPPGRDPTITLILPPSQVSPLLLSDGANSSSPAEFKGRGGFQYLQ